ncbi:MAG: DJ-1/PfpI family protein [Gammaproteobacteria bacterium]
MNRRQAIGATVGASVAVFGAAAATLTLTKRERVRVAFMLGDSANVIDTAGPWEVFQDVMVDGPPGHSHPFELYTVAPQAGLLRMTGGLQVKPDFTIEDAPAPNVIVVPAHRSTDASREWLRRASGATDVTMSVCTGAFQLARAGLLKGLQAATHHDFWDAFAKEFPDIELRRGLRFIDSGRIATAGGLTSGIDLALHIVQRYYGEAVASATARYIEYQSEAWRG